MTDSSAARDDFFTRIPPIYRLADITDARHFYDLPADWLIALSDVRGSTKAIEAGRYREVNAVAAANIAAMLNAMAGVDIPFVFGGDGATICLPPSKRAAAEDALLATRDLARESFKLELRIGVVPVRDVLAAGYTLRVARQHVSENFQQAVFNGGGLSHAETLLKAHGDAYAVPENTDYSASFEHFECRWNAIPATHGETLALIVAAVSGDDARDSAIYREVLLQLEAIYGSSGQRHPIAVRNLRVARRPGKFRLEAAIRYGDTSLRTLWRMFRNTQFAAMLMRFDIGEWGRYKHLLVDSTDNEKFDDTLRMVISGSAAQRESLRAYLESQRLAGRLVYGTHVSSHTLVTCIVFDYFGRQVHFVDGAQGGYAYAARELKAQLASPKP